MSHYELRSKRLADEQRILNSNPKGLKGCARKSFFRKLKRVFRKAKWITE